MKLPLACEALFIEQFITKKESQAVFNWLYNHHDLTDFEMVQLTEHHSHPIRPWKMMFVDPPLVDFKLFPKEHGRRSPFPPILEKIRNRINQYTGMQFSVCICLYYPNGDEYMDFHYDPPAFGPTNCIPSISLGGKREFILRRKENHEEALYFMLNDGSLLIMGNQCQDQYESSAPKYQTTLKPDLTLIFVSLLGLY